MLHDGLDQRMIRERILLTDSHGLLVEGRANLDDRKGEFAVDPGQVASWGISGDAIELSDVVKGRPPSILIGVTGVPGSFTEEMIRTMAGVHDHPIVMPLSNPTKNTEAAPAEIIRWSDGRALVATGSPFDPVSHHGETHQVGQANNVFVFPGIGLGAVVARARAITVEMFLAAARALADCVGDDRLKAGALFPPITDVRAVSRRVALAVIAAAEEGGVGGSLVNPEAAVDAAMWDPVYIPYRPG